MKTRKSCLNCGESFVARYPEARFCRRACVDAYNTPDDPTEEEIAAKAKEIRELGLPAVRGVARERKPRYFPEDAPRPVSFEPVRVVLENKGGARADY